MVSPREPLLLGLTTFKLFTTHTDVKARCDPHKTLWLDIKVNRQTRMHMDRSDRGFIWIYNQTRFIDKYRAGLPESIRCQPVVKGMSILRLGKRRHILKEEYLEPSLCLKRGSRMPLVGERRTTSSASGTTWPHRELMRSSSDPDIRMPPPVRIGLRNSHRSSNHKIGPDIDTLYFSRGTLKRSAGLSNSIKIFPTTVHVRIPNIALDFSAEIESRQLVSGWKPDPSVAPNRLFHRIVDILDRSWLRPVKKRGVLTERN